MIPQSNLAARQLSSIPQTHRTETLRAIAGKAHALSEKIQYLKTDGQRMSGMLQNVPENTGSRLAWLSAQLNQP